MLTQSKILMRVEFDPEKMNVQADCSFIFGHVTKFNISQSIIQPL